MAVLTRKAILEAQDLKRQVVQVAEWGGEVIVTELSAARRLEMEKSLPEEDSRIWPVLVAFCCVDEQGKPIFSLEDVQILEEKNAKTLIRVGRVALRLNRIGTKESDELEENFTSNQG